jgi:hypothetical protein
VLTVRGNGNQEFGIKNLEFVQVIPPDAMARTPFLIPSSSATNS